MHQIVRGVAVLGATLAVSEAWAVGLIAPLSWGMADRVASAIETADGTIYFAQSPSLLSVTTTHKTTYFWGATYYFTVSVPTNAGVPLQRVTIAQREGTDNLTFQLEDTRSFAGTRSDKGPKLPLSQVTADEKTRTVSITFDPPVLPGQTVTVGLRPYQNPSYSGIYLFGVTAFPAGEKPHGQFIGFGRLHVRSKPFRANRYRIRLGLSAKSA